MEKVLGMLLLVMSLMNCTQIEGACSDTIVSISGENREIPVGYGFNLSCKFTCLRPQHVGQIWKEDVHKKKVALVNITSTLPDVIVVLSISSALKKDAGYYSCMTQPPDAISPQVSILVSDNLTTSALTTLSTPQCDSTKQQNIATGLQGQMWFWILLGKTTVLFLCLAALAVQYKKS